MTQIRVDVAQKPFVFASEEDLQYLAFTFVPVFGVGVDESDHLVFLGEFGFFELCPESCPVLTAPFYGYHVAIYPVVFGNVVGK